MRIAHCMGQRSLLQSPLRVLRNPLKPQTDSAVPGGESNQYARIIPRAQQHMRGRPAIADERIYVLALGQLIGKLRRRRLRRRLLSAAVLRDSGSGQQRGGKRRAAQQQLQARLHGRY